MGVFDKVKSSISGSSSDDGGGKFESGQHENSFSTDSQSRPVDGNNSLTGKGSSQQDMPEELNDLGIDEPSPSPNQGSPQKGAGNREGQPVDNTNPAQRSNGQRGRKPGRDEMQPRTGGATNNPSQGPNTDMGGGQGNMEPSYGDKNARSRSSDSPNPQSGRPREGGSEPQLSSQTKEKMKDAGFNMEGRRGGGRNENARGKESVANQRDDLEEIKSQNEQIIELLKRINDSLGSGTGTTRHGGRRR